MSFVYGFVLWLLLPLAVYLFKRTKAQSFVQNLRWMVLVLLILALSRPVLLEHLSTEKFFTHSLVIALDLSVSMNANDIEPTRAKASRKSIEKFLDLKGKNQISLVGFTSNPLLLSPPTTDYFLLKQALANINPKFILTKGTNLKKLFEKVAKFKGKEKLLILFSDGGDEALDASLGEFLEEKNIKLFAIGMATEQGSPIKTDKGTLLEDNKGHIVISKLNHDLEALAVQSGGEFVGFLSVEQSVEALEDFLNKTSLEKEAIEKESRAYVELFAIPLALGILIFFLSSTHFSKKILALFLLMGFNVQAQELITRASWGEGLETVHLSNSTNSLGIFDAYYLHKAYAFYEEKKYKQSQKEIYKLKNRNLEATLLLAHTFYKQAKYKVAKSILQTIKSSNKEVKQRLYYELGNCEAQMRYMQRAKDYYVKALQLGEDADALANLEWVSLRLKEDAFKVGYTKPSSAEASKNKIDKSEETQEDNKEKSSQNKDAKGNSSSSASQKSKNSSLKIMKSNEQGSTKRTFSSKAYDLINEGYIREEKPY